MDYVNLGKTGLKVSKLCLGCMTYGSSKWRPWVLDYDASLPFSKQAWDAGVNFYDTADMYSVGASEEVTGKALKEVAGKSWRDGFGDHHQGVQPDDRRATSWPPSTPA